MSRCWRAPRFLASSNRDSGTRAWFELTKRTILYRIQPLCSPRTGSSQPVEGDPRICLGLTGATLFNHEWLPRSVRRSRSGVRFRFMPTCAVAGWRRSEILAADRSCAEHASANHGQPVPVLRFDLGARSNGVASRHGSDGYGKLAWSRRSHPRGSSAGSANQISRPQSTLRVTCETMN